MKNRPFETYLPTVLSQQAYKNPALMIKEHVLNFSTHLEATENSSFVKENKTYPSTGTLVSLRLNRNTIEIVDITNTSIGELPEDNNYLKAYLKNKIEFIGMVSYQGGSDVIVDIMPL